MLCNPKCVFKTMDTCRLNRKIFEWAERNSNGRCQNWNYKVNKMLMEAGIAYEHGATNPKVMKANLADYLFHKFVTRGQMTYPGIMHVRGPEETN